MSQTYQEKLRKVDVDAFERAWAFLSNDSNGTLTINRSWFFYEIAEYLDTTNTNELEDQK